MKRPVLALLLALGLQKVALAQSDFQSLSQEMYQEVIVQIVGLLGNEDLLKEMEIVPSQVAEIRERIAAAKKTMADISAEAIKREKETGDNAAFNKTMTSAWQDYTRAWETILADVLLPHQRQQLNRLMLWSIIKKGTGFDTIRKGTPFQSNLQRGIVRELIKIDESQSKSIDEHSEQLQDEFARELAALHDKYEEKLQEKLQEKLRPEQREKLKELLGETPAFIFR